MTTKRPRLGLKLLLLLGLILLVPVALMVLVFPLLLEQPFESADELTPDNIQSIRVFILNRKELDGGEDIGPYMATSGDYEALLAPLKSVAEVDQYPDARGPWLGELRIRTKTGRKGTIRLYWVKSPSEPETVPARLRFQIGPHKYEGGTAQSMIAAAERGAKMGTKVR